MSGPETFRGSAEPSTSAEDVPAEQASDETITDEELRVVAEESQSEAPPVAGDDLTELRGFADEGGWALEVDGVECDPAASESQGGDAGAEDPTQPCNYTPVTWAASDGRIITSYLSSSA